MKFLRSTNSDVCALALMTLGNIAGDCAELRDSAIECGIVEPLLALVRDDTPVALLRRVAWTLSMLCHSEHPAPSWNVVDQLVPTLLSLMDCTNDEGVRNETYSTIQAIGGHLCMQGHCDVLSCESCADAGREELTLNHAFIETG